VTRPGTIAFIAPWLALIMLAACSEPTSSTCSGPLLFGRPNAETGLSSSQCGPRCSCSGDTWEAPEYTAADAAALRRWTLLDPPAELTADPYAAPAPAPEDTATVCAVERDATAELTYRLHTYPSAADAEAAGAIVTHHGGCGLCSTLTDLAVYMQYPDLTAPVRQCGIDHLNDAADEHIQCLRDLGFTTACAQIWYWNTVHTRDVCGAPCFLAIGKPYHNPDGTLNDCLQCDEDMSGAIFKAVAGRTRRNTGIASAMCRPCDEVHPLTHQY
jgi:hypothetical protein